MKMYVGGEAQQADIQRKRGFKTYRDLYNRQIVELEAENKLLKEELQSVEVLYLKHDRVNVIRITLSPKENNKLI